MSKDEWRPAMEKLRQLVALDKEYQLAFLVKPVRPETIKLLPMLATACRASPPTFTLSCPAGWW
jgi:hypothetical protein